MHKNEPKAVGPKQAFISFEAGLGLAFLAAVTAAFNLKLVLTEFGPGLARSMEAALGILKGEPLWRVFQSRLFGPHLARLVGYAFDLEFPNAYLVTLLGGLFVFYLAVAFIAKHLFKANAAPVIAIVGAGYFNALFMRGRWLYIWDAFELLALALVTWAILSNKPLKVLSWILVLAAFNRETSVIVALWLVLDACVRSQPAGSGRFVALSLDKDQLRTGGLLTVGIYLALELVRKELMVREIGPIRFTDVERQAGELAHIQLGLNFESLIGALSAPLENERFLYTIVVFAIPILAAVGLRAQQQPVRRASSLTLVLWLATVAFGFIYEYRVWLTFVPFLVLVAPQILGLRVEAPALALSPASETTRSGPSPAPHQDSSVPSL